MSDPQLDLFFTRDAITALAISLTSSLLLVGTAAGLIYVYDIPSHQPLRTISTHQGYSITCLASILKPPDLIGHISLSLAINSVADAKDVIPKPVSPFQRTRDAKAREAHEVPMTLPAQKTVCTMKHEALNINA
jgi:pre-rRNA-processing protein IPI3